MDPEGPHALIVNAPIRRAWRAAGTPRWLIEWAGASFAVDDARRTVQLTRDEVIALMRELNRDPGLVYLE